jgi:hypothetical protein
MAWMTLGLLAFIFVACWAAGAWIGGRPRSVALAAAALTLGLVALRLLFRFRPEIEFPLISSSLYSAIRPWWVFPLVFISLGIGARRMRRLPWRAAMGVAAAALFAFALQAPWARATFDPGQFGGKPDRDGVCQQTQAFSCGAAAAATLLTNLGIRTSECEMSKLCCSTPLTGTDEIAVCCALRTKLQDCGYSVALERPTPDRLERRLRPVMVRLRSDALRDHWVVLYAINDRTAVLGDPAQGKTTIPVGDFYSAWRGTIVTVGPEFAGSYAVR